MTEDEKLSRFLDNDLGDDERAELQSVVSTDAIAKTKLERMRANDDLVRKAFDAPMREDVPDRFLNAIDAGLARQATARPDNVVSLEDRLPRSGNDNRRAWWPIGGAIAASLAVGLLLGTQFAPAGDATTSLALNDVLNDTPSTQTISLKSGERVTPELTFERRGGGYCRRFGITDTDSKRLGLACRTDGHWTVEALLPAGTASSAQDGYVAAEGPGDAGMDGVIDTLRAGDPLDKAAENALIARRWR
jgi:hypothetical protein